MKQVRVRPYSYRRKHHDTRTKRQIQRGKLVTEIETSAQSGMFDRLIFSPSSFTEAGRISRDIVDKLYAESGLDIGPDERRALIAYGRDRILSAVNRQRAIRGGKQRQ